MRILLLIHYYPPEIGAPQRRWGAFVERWVAAGHTVSVVAPMPHYPSGHADPDYHARQFRRSLGQYGENLYRVPFLPGAKSTRGRLADQAVVAAASVPVALTVPCDVILATAPGLPTIFLGPAVAAVRRQPLVVEMRDAWPDLIEQASLASGRVARALSWSVTAIQRHADAVVTTSYDFTETLKRRRAASGRVFTVLNGFDTSKIPLLETPRESGVLRVLYLGTVGLSQGLDSAVRAAAKLGPDMVQLTIIGDGLEKDNLVRLA